MKTIFEDLLSVNDSPSGLKDDGGPVWPVEPIDPVEKEILTDDVNNHATVSPQPEINWWLIIAAAAGIAYAMDPKKAKLYVPVVVLGGLGLKYLTAKKTPPPIVAPVETN